jgi:hypothetical protein
MFKNPNSKCKNETCKETSIYGKTEPSHCEEHSLEDEICLITSKCKGCCRTDELINREGLCIAYCSPSKIYEKLKLWVKVKENNMIDYLNKNIKDEGEFKIQDDVAIDRNCNLYRPDRVYDLGTHAVIVECDEEQHKNYKYCSSYESLKHAELCRMHEIYNALGIPCIFLRWNPDSFKVNGKICHKYTLEYRLELLVKWVKYCFLMIPNTEYSPVKYKYLFYDDYDEKNISFQEIDDTKLIIY